MVDRELLLTILHRPLIEPDDVKWRLAGQDATTLLNSIAGVRLIDPRGRGLQKQNKKSPPCGSKHHETELCSSRDCFGPADVCRFRPAIAVMTRIDSSEEPTIISMMAG